MHAHFARCLIEKQINKIENLKEVTRHNFIFVDWQQKTEKLLQNIFGENSVELSDFKKIHFQPTQGLYVDLNQNKIVYLQGLEEAKQLLEQVKNRDINVYRNAIGTDGSNFKKVGEQSFIAFDHLDKNLLIFETIICKDDFSEAVKQFPQDQQLEIMALVDELFMLFQSKIRNKERLKEVKKHLLNLIGEVNSAPILSFLILLVELNSFI